MRGLVEVEQQYVINAVSNYRSKEAELISAIKACKKELEDQYDTLTWWQKLWNEDDSTPKWKVVAKAKKLRGLYTYFPDVWLSILKSSGIVEDSFAERLYETDRWRTFHIDVVDELEAMVEAGNYLLITPLQARFVNDFKKEEG